MNKTKIDWTDYTWNPITGCLHNCKKKYGFDCYAEKIANRFDSKEEGIFSCNGTQKGDIHEGLFEKPFPYGFDPTFYVDRLEEPQKLKKPSTIFVCSMADLFGDWVPEDWILRVFEACEKAPQHQYIFLTKNPKRYSDFYERKLFPYKENYFFGTTVITSKDEFVWFKNTPYKSFLSIEPIMEPLENTDNENLTDMIILGAETGRKGKVIPKKEWVTDIVLQADKRNISVFMKESLRGLMGEDFRQDKLIWEIENA